jgi:hypothetical protein
MFLSPPKLSSWEEHRELKPNSFNGGCKTVCLRCDLSVSLQRRRGIKRLFAIGKSDLAIGQSSIPDHLTVQPFYFFFFQTSEWNKSIVFFNRRLLQSINQSINQSSTWSRLKTFIYSFELNATIESLWTSCHEAI